MIVTSFKTTPQISARTSIFWPQPFTLDQFGRFCSRTPFLTWFANSVLVAAVSTMISVVFAALAAYALSRLKFLGSGLLTSFLLITYLLPQTLIFIPLYQTLTTLGLVNTYGALMFTYPTFLLPFATWVLIGYFRSIPVELEEAAMIDGASRIYAFWKITLPLAAPAVLSVALFAFTTAWNEFLFAFVFITKESLRTLPIGLQVAGVRRHPAVGTADGGVAAHRGSGCRALHLRPAVPRRRIDGRSRQGLTLAHLKQDREAIAGLERQSRIASGIFPIRTVHMQRLGAVGRLAPIN